MSNTQKAIEILQQKIEQLLSNYEFLKEENNVLFNTNSTLQAQLKEKEQLLEKQQQQMAVLKVAKTIEGSNKDVKETKQKINSLIREIDKCISLLNN